MTYFWRGKPEEAIPIAKRAIQINPLYPFDALMVLGLAYFSLENYEKATPIFENIAKNQPNRIGSQLRLVGCYTALGRTDEANAVVSEVLRINPKFTLERLSKTLPYQDQAAKERFFTLLREAGLPE
jgi:adenylate cyclase